MYCENLTRFKRRKSYKVKVGDVIIGGQMPIVVQTMTSTATNDIEGTINQIIRSVKAGAQIIRITVPSLRDIEPLKAIKAELRARGYKVPLVADIHFNQKIAFEAARIVEKVRINPGNFADSKKFQQLNYSEEDYANELIRIREEFVPLLKICEENSTALRIGTNHGSLSDRIMSRYGDTPEGMMESAMEFLRICKENNFLKVVVSMKASNTMVMVQAMRLLVEKMENEDMHYPLHLGVTEAGEGEDGRIKSAVGIGALLADGIGDTIRVSLTEEPELEIPVAQKLIRHFEHHIDHNVIEPFSNLPYNPYSFNRRKTSSVLNIGGNNVPVVISNSELINNELVADFFHIKEIKEAILPNKKYLYEVFESEQIHSFPANIYPIVSWKCTDIIQYKEPAFISIETTNISGETIEWLQKLENKVLLISSNNINKPADLRAAILRLKSNNIDLPVIIQLIYTESDIESLQVKAAADLGGLLLDGLCDGLWIENNGSLKEADICSTVFGILQASRMRVSKPEYISCPSCGRTQFNIQDTTKQIRTKTAHLTGLKIGIMGCIVNGLGEMADADYGYIGGALGKVNLYHQKDLIKRGVPENLAVDELVALIKEKGDWVEP